MKVMESGEDFAGTLVRRPDLLLRIQVFVHRPDLWLHPSRLAEDTSGRLLQFRPQFSEGDASRRLTSAYSQALASDCGFDPLDYREFAPSLRRVALLSTPLLEKLAATAGRFRLAPRIAGCLRRDEAARLRQTLGEKSWAEVLRLSPLLLREGEAAACSKEELLDDPASAVFRAGWEGVGIALRGAPEALRRRLEWKVPDAAVASLRHGAEATGSDRGELLVRLLRNLLNRRAAETVF
ncbi:MAG: SctK family type III secretion system sorting platform protein [Verrucomicrobiales bacterium]|nr:SctK family type III secretion system sorting platform protein [Verrucomicrobiales bacterium]